MKHLLSALLLLSGSAVEWMIVLADTLSIHTSPIESILILGNNIAEITRSFSHQRFSSSGYHTIILENLPSTLIDQSIHLQSSSQHTQVISSSVLSHSLTREEDSSFQNYFNLFQKFENLLRQKINSLENEKTRVEMRLEIIDKYLNSLFENSQLRLEDLPLTSILEIIEKREEELTKREQRLTELTFQLHRLKDVFLAKILATQQTLSQTGYYIPFPCEEFKKELEESQEQGELQCSLLASSIQHWPATRTTKDLSLHVHVSASTIVEDTFHYSMTYLTEAGAATWSPQYDIRYEGEINPADFTYTLHIELYAHIDQNTGPSTPLAPLNHRRRGLDQLAIDSFNCLTNSTHSSSF
jgi:hypothetical protein